MENKQELYVLQECSMLSINWYDICTSAEDESLASFKEWVEESYKLHSNHRIIKRTIITKTKVLKNYK